MGFFSKFFGKNTPSKTAPPETAPPKTTPPETAPPKPNAPIPKPTLDLPELAKRLNTPLESLIAIPITYRELHIPKRDGSLRTLHAPDEPLKKIQRTILHRLLAKLPAHPAATGFEKAQSIATNAAPHVGAAVILKLDMKNFFTALTPTQLQGWKSLQSMITAHQTPSPSPPR